MKKGFFFFTIYCLLSTVSAHAQSVDLLWEGKGYVPPFYQGGAPWTSEGAIRFVAVPQGLGAPASLTYKWSRNGTVLGETNGVGVRTLEIQDSIFSRPQTVSVEIMSDEDILASAAVTVTPRAPSLLIYERHPLFGFLFNKEASRGYSLDESEASFTVFPLFYTIPGRDFPYVKYTWRSRGGEDSTSDSVTYRVPEGATGAASVSVKVHNTERIRQTMQTNFLVQFNNASNQ